MTNSLNKASEISHPSGIYVSGMRAERYRSRSLKKTAPSAMSERSKAITYIRMPNSKSVDDLLKVNDSLKKEILEAVDEMSIKLNKSKATR